MSRTAGSGTRRESLIALASADGVMLLLFMVLGGVQRLRQRELAQCLLSQCPEG